MSSNLVTTQSSAIFYIFTIVCFTMMVSSTGLKLESQRRNRSELGIVSDVQSVIAEAGQEGEIISKISRKANLSYDEAMGKCGKLAKEGLVYSVHNDKNRFFAITEKGIQFFQEFQKFNELVRSLNLFHAIRI